MAPKRRKGTTSSSGRHGKQGKHASGTSSSTTTNSNNRSNTTSRSRSSSPIVFNDDDDNKNNNESISNNDVDATTTTTTTTTLTTSTSSSFSRTKSMTMKQRQLPNSKNRQQQQLQQQQSNSTGSSSNLKSTIKSSSSSAAAAVVVVGTTTTTTTNTNDDTTINTGFDGKIYVPHSTIIDVNDLILTCTEKRRNIYECDYCHNDISQLPRIRCAVCIDFDLCFDCFATVDHVATLKRLKATTATQYALQEEGIVSSVVSSSTNNTTSNAVVVSSSSAVLTNNASDLNDNKKGDSSTSNDTTTGVHQSTHTSMLVTAANISNHDPSHGYRVCDSTRFPLFPTSKQVTDCLASNSTVTAIRTNTNKASTTSTTTINTNDNKNTSSSSSAAAALNVAFIMQCENDNKNYWTVEEDLRLIEGIKTHGLGNWVEIADAVGGYSSVGKTPKRCMERYFDDYLGRYGCIVPQYTFVPVHANTSSNTNTTTSTSKESKTKTNDEMDTSTQTETSITTIVEESEDIESTDKTNTKVNNTTETENMSTDDKVRDNVQEEDQQEMKVENAVSTSDDVRMEDIATTTATTATLTTTTVVEAEKGVTSTEETVSVVVDVDVAASEGKNDPVDLIVVSEKITDVSDAVAVVDVETKKESDEMKVTLTDDVIPEKLSKQTDVDMEDVVSEKESSITATMVAEELIESPPQPSETKSDVLTSSIVDQSTSEQSNYVKTIDTTATTTDSVVVSDATVSAAAAPPPPQQLIASSSGGGTRSSKRRSGMMRTPGNNANVIVYNSFSQLEASGMSAGDFLQYISNTRKPYKAISSTDMIQCIQRDEERLEKQQQQQQQQSCKQEVKVDQQEIDIDAPKVVEEAVKDKSSRSKKRKVAGKLDSNRLNDDDANRKKTKGKNDTENNQGKREKYKFSNWPAPYIPTMMTSTGGIGGCTVLPEFGQEVGRDQSTKAELMFVKAVAACETKEQVNKIRNEWAATRLNKPGGPTALPMRPEDIVTLPGCELAGYMPRRGDFDVEWDNDAEEAIADIEFIPGESEDDKNLKVRVLEIYNRKLEERDKRKHFIISRSLYDYRKHQEEYYKTLPKDERDLVLRMRLFERFHTPDEHKQFLADILKAKRLRKEIAKLQSYRRLGIRTLLEAEMYELDKQRRNFHHQVAIQKTYNMTNNNNSRTTSTSGIEHNNSAIDSSNHNKDNDSSMTYWKQYRKDDRRIRKSVNRGIDTDPTTVTSTSTTTLPVIANPNEIETKFQEGIVDGNKVISDVKIDSMDIDKSETMNEENIQDSKGSLKSDTVVNESSNIQHEETTTPSVAIKATTTTTTTSVADAVISNVTRTTTNSTKTTINDDEFDISSSLTGYELLSRKEIKLCQTVRITPSEYLVIKRALIQEAFTNNLLSKSSSNTNNISNPIMKLDIERRGPIIDFVISAGWMPANIGQNVKSK